LVAGRSSTPLRVSKNVDSKNPTKVIDALSPYLNYDKIEMQRGVGYYAVVFFGLETTGRAYVANKHPVQISFPTPSPNLDKLPMFAYQLRIAGDNFTAIRTNTRLAITVKWDQIAIGSNPKPITALLPLRYKIRKFLNDHLFFPIHRSKFS
jgi:hypothetical protein